jgi:hypothetical protein
MGLFGNGHGERIAELERQVSALTKRVVAAEQTASDCADRAYRFLKKAESRSRRELDGTPNQEPVASRGRREPPVAASSQRATWGPRARRLARMTRRDPADEADAADEALVVRPEPEGGE